MPAGRTGRARRVLVVDVGGSQVKARVSGSPHEVRFPSGPRMTPAAMIRILRRRVPKGTYDVVSLGYPGLVRRNAIEREPIHLGRGWVGFDFRRAFGRPVRIVNDAALQALGSYEGGSMLFLGLGTGLGSAMVVEGRLVPMELAHLPYRKGRTFEEYVGKTARERLGRKRWHREVHRVVEVLTNALEPDYVVLGGGNVHKLEGLPAGVRPGHNDRVFVGGARLWEEPEGEGRPRRRTPKTSGRKQA
jgi:glucose-6-phosphate isomerase